MYGFNTPLSAPFDKTVPKVVVSSNDEAFGLPGGIGMQATLKQRLGVDFAPYRILGACNPSLAHQALQAEPDICLRPDAGPREVSQHRFEWRGVPVPSGPDQIALNC